MPTSGPTGNLVDDEHVLDSTLALALGVGMRKMTMADIGRAAGVSRATLYRRWPNVRAVVAALVTRELGDIGPPDSTGTGRDRLVGLLVHAARTVRAHPLLRKIVEVDPEFLLPYLLRRRGSSTQRQLEQVTCLVATAQEEGSVRRGAPGLLARVLVQTTMSYVLTGPIMVDETVRLEDLDVELVTLLDRYLAP